MPQFSSLYGSYLDTELGTDDSTVLFTTARRKTAVNRGIEEFAKLTECWQRTSTITLTGGTGEYDLNSTTMIADGDFVRFSKAQVEFHYTDASSNETILTGDDLPRRDVDYLNRYVPGWKQSTVASSVQQFPENFYLREDGGQTLLGFTPVPSTGSSASMKAVVPYVARPIPITSDTQEPFTVSGNIRRDLRPYHMAPVHYAAHQLEKLRRDDQASDRQLQKFMGYVASWMQEHRVKGGTTITYQKNYFARGGSVSDQGEDPRT